MVRERNGCPAECYSSGREGKYDGRSSRQKRTLLPFIGLRLEARTRLESFFSILLDVQLMLRAITSQRKVLHNERSHRLHIIEVEPRNVQIDRLVRHYGQQALR